MAEPLVALRDRAVFEQALKSKPLARSEHFVLHHCFVAEKATASVGLKHPAAVPDPLPTSVLSTNGGQSQHAAVDNSISFRSASAHQTGALCLGLVVPKRHAKRAVTRNTIKRQARALGSLHREALGAGAYVLRLKATFGPPTYRAATSNALRAAVRHEINAMFVAATTVRVARAATLKLAP
jgi:ribonuclease P protein component